jgi:tetratricopeptide (TPR) repeat protein
MLVQTKPSSMVIAPSDAGSTVTVGLDSFFGPVSEFELELSKGGAESDALRGVVAAPERRSNAILSEIAETSVARAERLQDSKIAWLEAGMACLAKGDLELARAAFQRVLEQEPTNRRALLGIARTAKAAGEMAEAIQHLSLLHAQDSHDVEVAVSLALALFSAGREDEAMDNLRLAVSQEPRFASFFAVRGSIQLAKQDWAGAIRDLRKAVNLRPDWVYARNVLGIAEAKSGNLSGAERRFREAIRVGPMYTEPLLNLVTLLMHQRRWNEILDNIERYWTPTDSPAKLAIYAATACLELENWRGARDWLLAASTKESSPVESALILNNLGVALSRLDKLDEAENYYLASVAALATDYAIGNYAKVLLDKGEAEAALQWLLTEHPPARGTDPVVRSTLAFTLMQVGQTQLAIDVARQLVAEDSADAGAFSLLGMLYVDGLEDAELAIELFGRGLERWPADVILRNNLAYSLLLAGRVDEAASILQKLAEESTTAESATYVLATRGLLELYRGRLSDGWRLYEEAAATAPSAALRERAKVKRDLEMARALLRLGEPRDAAQKLLSRAADGPASARPFTEHAAKELRLLRGVRVK